MRIKQLKLKFAFNFLPTLCDKLYNGSLLLLDNQLHFLDGLKRLSENLPLANSLQLNWDDYKPYLVHSWLLNIPDLGKTLCLQAATLQLWTVHNDPKDKYLYGNLTLNYIWRFSPNKCIINSM